MVDDPASADWGRDGDRGRDGGGGGGWGRDGGGGWGRDGGGGWSGGEMAGALARWAAEASAAEAAAGRSRERWLRQQAGEAATLAGVLVDLAERRAMAAVATRSASHTGRLVGVGRDFCVVASRSSAVVALDAVVTVTALPGASPDGSGGVPPGDPGGDRSPAMDLGFEEVLSELSADRSPVRLRLAGGSVVTATLAGVGSGILHCRLAAPGRRTVTVVTASVESCTPG